MDAHGRVTTEASSREPCFGPHDRVSNLVCLSMCSQAQQTALLQYLILYSVFSEALVCELSEKIVCMKPHQASFADRLRSIA
ncbi:hypothetical protein BHE74_00040878 [Ensete ventricosum]|nr:hypothetical protein GW17_00051691 [Ensete ventricosum]RWW52694.1 hypothetical protein BHE74_00040878 [Ensete ventricosum]